MGTKYIVEKVEDNGGCCGPIMIAILLVCALIGGGVLAAVVSM